MSQNKRADQSGFTIMELLIATLVFSVILLVIMTGILQFSRQYYKGVIDSETQDTARSIMDEITRAIQLDSGGYTPLTGGANYSGFCIGSSRRYSFSQNYEVTTTSHTSSLHQGYHGLIEDDVSGCTGAMTAVNAQSQKYLTPTPLPSPFTVTSHAHELLGEHMRLVNLSVAPIGTTGAYNVAVIVAYGDDDLLCSPSIAGSCADTATLQSQNLAGKTDLKCKLSSGSQFCAVSTLSSTVQARVQ